MSFNLLIGNTNTGKSTYIIDNLIQKINEEPLGDNIYLIVPENRINYIERKILNTLGDQSFFRLQVLSFKRLAYIVHQSLGGLKGNTISNEAFSLILNNIIDENKDKLKAFPHMCGKLDFSKKLLSLMNDFRRSCVDTKELHKAYNMIDRNLLKSKIHDMTLLYEELNNKTQNKYLTNDDYYNLLIEKVKEASFLTEAEIYIDEFDMFTKQEILIIKELIMYSTSLTLSLTMGIDMSFHAPCNEIYNELTAYAENNNINYLFHSFKENKYHEDNKELLFLSDNFNKLKYEVYSRDVNNIKIFTTVDPKIEIHEVARRILQKVKYENCRYNEFTIYTNNLSMYSQIVNDIFSSYNIPIDTGIKYHLMDYSGINFIDALLEMIETDFSYESVFRVLKSEVFINISDYEKSIIDYRYKLDIFENYVLAYNKEGYESYKEKWEYESYRGITSVDKKRHDEEDRIEELVNEFKDTFIGIIEGFIEEFKNRVTVKDRIKTIYALMVKINLKDLIDTQLKNQEYFHFVKSGNKVWEKLIDYFDNVVEVIGDKEYSLENTISILRSGINSLSVKLVSKKLDQVSFSDLSNTRPNKYGFLVGATEGDIPKQIKDTNLLLESDKEILTELGIKLSKGIQEKTLDEYYLIYKTLLSAEKELTLSCSLTSLDGKPKLVSDIINKVKNIFPKVEFISAIGVYIKPEYKINKYITNHNNTALEMLNQLYYENKGIEINDTWHELKDYYKNSEYSYVTNGLTYKNVPSKLSKKNALNLYGNSIKASISRIELFNNCPYAHFLSYGLRLQERDVYGINMADIGQLFHETLRMIQEVLAKENKTWKDYSIEEYTGIVKETTNELSDKLKRKILLSNKRNLSILSKLQIALLKSLSALSYHSEKGSFKTFAVEEEFSINASKLKVDSKKVSNDVSYSLKGIIDRIDICKDEDRTYIGVMDYKSSHKDLQMEKVYHSLSLQLITYIDIILKYGHLLDDNDVLVAGVFYFKVHRPLLKLSSEKEIDELDQKMINEYKLSGYSIGERKIFEKYDGDIDDGYSSNIIPVKLNKSGTIGSYSKVLSRADIDVLCDYVEKSIEQSVRKIAFGVVSISPKIYKDSNACKYCAYKPICKFDDNLDENYYVKLKQFKRGTDHIALMKERLEGDSNE